MPLVVLSLRLDVGGGEGPLALLPPLELGSLPVQPPLATRGRSRHTQRLVYHSFLPL